MNQPPLKPGTKVTRRPPVGQPRYEDLDPCHNGRVPPYQMDLPTNLGWFPVRWRSGITEICDVTDVIVVAETVEKMDAA